MTQYLNCAATDVLNFNDVIQVAFAAEQSSLLSVETLTEDFAATIANMASDFQAANVGGLVPLSPFTVPPGATSIAINFFNPSSTPVSIQSAVAALSAEVSSTVPINIVSVNKITLSDAMGASAAGELAAAAGAAASSQQGTSLFSQIGAGVSSAVSGAESGLASLETPVLVVGGLILAFLVWEGSRKAKLFI